MIEAFPTVRQEPGNSQGSGQGDVSFSNTTVFFTRDRNARECIVPHVDLRALCTLCLAHTPNPFEESEFRISQTKLLP